ncbi:MAG: YibE/F family protein [Oscillospiraceae bacterium]|jgi:uncharacterized membrane protein|nr:YibE/F family protein [Oscillospiraceae bacterium]
MNHKRLWLLALPLALLSLASCAGVGERPAPSLEDWAVAADALTMLRARIISVDSEVEQESTDDEGQGVRTTLFTARITSGPMRGCVVSGQLVVHSSASYPVRPPRTGNSIFLMPSWDADGLPLGDFGDYNRTAGLLALFVIFVAVLCIVGGKVGARSLLALVFTCAGIVFIFIPMVKAGVSPIFAALLISALVTVITLAVIGGFGAKTFAALLGIITGLIISGILTTIMQAAMKLTGVVDNEALLLSQRVGMEGVSLNGLMFAAILIGALGAAMDVGVSIASALEELNRKSGLQGAELVESGMRIGRDVMGTMTNTLVLAYVGGSLHLMLLISVESAQLDYLLSWELIATELLRALAGSVGLICIVPATALVSAVFCRVKTAPENPFA